MFYVYSLDWYLILLSMSIFSLHLTFFVNIQNGSELKKAINEIEEQKEGNFELVIPTELIFDELQVRIAAFQAIHNFEKKALKTKNVGAELLYHLAPTNNVC